MRAVFHLISSAGAEQERALTIAGNLLDDDSVELDDLAVAAQAAGIEPLLGGGERSETAADLIDRGVSFKACGNTLEMEDLTETDLREGVERVPSGAGELV
jgi:intracellular sulfur oxidation DsrE/DsrF family protein